MNHSFERSFIAEMPQLPKTPFSDMSMNTDLFNSTAVELEYRPFYSLFSLNQVIYSKMMSQLHKMIMGCLNVH
jgi:hypothetical protein